MDAETKCGTSAIKWLIRALRSTSSLTVGDIHKVYRRGKKEMRFVQSISPASCCKRLNMSHF